MDCYWMGIDIGSKDGDRTAYFTVGEAPDFEPGDIVRLIVGGPDMVVNGYCEACGDVDVAWATSDGDVMRDTFPEEALVEVE